MAVFNKDTFTCTRKSVPDPGRDSNVPAINQGAGAGKRIAGDDFLSYPNLTQGQDQVLVHTGNQSVLLDHHRFQWITSSEFTHIVGTRDTTVERDEQYVNEKRFTHLVSGPFHEEHVSTTTGVYHKRWDATYQDDVKTTENKNVTHTRVRNERLFHLGDYLRAQYGSRTVFQFGTNVNVLSPLRVTGIFGAPGGIDIKATSVDLGLAEAKLAISRLDTKLSFFEVDGGMVKAKANTAELKALRVIIRTAIADVKAAVLSVGTIRW
jgi:hypothetical protein